MLEDHKSYKLHIGVELPYGLTPDDITCTAKAALRLSRAIALFNHEPQALNCFWIERMDVGWLRGTSLGNHCRLVHIDFMPEHVVALHSPFTSSWLLHEVANARRSLTGGRKQSLKLYARKLEWRSARSAVLVGPTKHIGLINRDENHQPTKRAKKSQTDKPTSDDEAEALASTPADDFDHAAMDENDWVKALAAALNISVDEGDMESVDAAASADAEDQQQQQQHEQQQSMQQLVQQQNAETVWKEHVQKSIDAFRWRMASFKRATTYGHVKNKNSSLLTWSNLQTMPMVMLQHSDCGAVDIYNWVAVAGTVQWCNTSHVVSSGWGHRIREHKLARFMSPMHMWDQKVDTSGFKA